MQAKEGWAETLKGYIDQISQLIKTFTEMMTNFVASWKRVPHAATINED